MSTSSSTIGGIAATVLTVFLIIGGITLKIGARALRNSARNGGSSTSWNFSSSSAPTWDEVLAAKNQLMQEIFEDAQALQAAHNGNVPFEARNRFMQRVREKATKVDQMFAQAERKYGPPSDSMKVALLQIPSVDQFQNNSTSYTPPSPYPTSSYPSGADYQAQLEARRQQEEADRLARQQQYEAARETARQAEEQRRAEQAERSRQFAEQQRAEREAREQALRDRMNALANSSPPQFVPPPPPQFNPPAAPAPEPQQPAAPPGFPATDLAQIKLRDSIFVAQGDKWFPALVTLKRGKLVQVRYLTNGAIDVVTLDRIRVQNEPVAKAGVPGALQAVDRKPSEGNGLEPEDDALFVAKPPPRNQPAAGDTQSETTPAPSASSVSASPAEGVLKRTWSDSTGSFQVEAELIGFEFNLVQLKKQDGKVLSVPLEKLSAADQQIVRERYK